LNKFARRPWDDSPTESEPFNYGSSTLKFFLEDIEKQSSASLLDVGPIYRQNIEYLSRHIQKLFVCDLFRRLKDDRQANMPVDKYWRYLDYPANIFDGILLWNLIDRLEPDEIRSLIDRCHDMTKPGGLVMLFSMSTQVSPTGQNVFVIQEDSRLYIRERLYPHLPAKQRQNRDYLHLLSPFTPIKSLIYRNGVREFLFQKD